MGFWFQNRVNQEAKATFRTYLKKTIRNDVMKRNTIKWRIFKYNLLVIILLIALTTIIFNIAVRQYFEKDITNQLSKIASQTEDTALRKGPDFFPGNNRLPPPPPDQNNRSQNNSNKLYQFYFMLDHSLSEPLSVLNADFVLLDKNKNIINPSSEGYFNISTELLNKFKNEINKSKNFNGEKYFTTSLSGTTYTAIVKPVFQKNTFGLGWIVIYSSLNKVNQLQLVINIILFAILIFSALVIVFISSIAAKKITAPFSSLNLHISSIAERNFGTMINMPVYDELQEVVNNINVMSEKLETYDKAQKTFLQNASHEFRTPLMSIQGYAEGIKYDVVDNNNAANVIIDETKRMTHLVEDLLYLSRLESIEENYHFNNLVYDDLISSCIDRINGIALKSGIKVSSNILGEKYLIFADEEKLSRAITNILSNCIRYANSSVEINTSIKDMKNIRLTIADDGPGFDSSELPNIFERFFKGKKGNFGLGLAISKNVIEKHKGNVSAENTESGALFIIDLPAVVAD